ncbi:YafY family protein [Kordia sp.]|uniref:helix-turn-helix transcriptional regulator n=1 Tax=Kordia sp. TaxID=1965332 RepID=UPI0025C68A33|nr:YafY family protein [Kordia sp.]MCH2195547.1 YafY family transcriptional regulator [Kordia sp.]
MTQLARLISILTLLRSKRLLTASELAEKYDVSVRTIYRDIRKLEEAGVPVYTLEGRGYSLIDTYTIAPVQFTEKQANALITAEHIINQSKDASFVNDFKEALTKIKSVFKTSVQEKSEILSDKIHVFNWKLEDTFSDALSEIQLAVTNFNVMEINYKKANDYQISNRKIEPYAMYSTDNKWILIAWCHLRNDMRAFRIDRIQNFKILEEKFEDRKFNINDYFALDTCNSHNCKN